MLFCMRNNFCDKQQTIVVLCNLSVTHFSLGYVFTSIKMPSVWEEKDLQGLTSGIVDPYEQNEQFGDSLQEKCCQKLNFTVLEV